MKLHYYPETDILYIELKDISGVETREVAPGLNVDFDEKGEVVGFDIDHASRKLDLSKVETIGLPVRKRGLTALLKSMTPVDDEFPEIEGLAPQSRRV